MTYVTGVAALAHIQQQQRIVIIILRRTSEPITIPIIAIVDKTAPIKLWTSLDELESLYAKYWFTYDEKQGQKEDFLRRLDELIAEKEYELENSWIFSKIAKAKKCAELKVDKTTISLWFIQPYWQIDDKKVTVWDMVDVYIDPDKPERYWVDTDFLF